MAAVVAEGVSTGKGEGVPELDALTPLSASSCASVTVAACFPTSSPAIFKPPSPSLSTSAAGVVMLSSVEVGNGVASSVVSVGIGEGAALDELPSASACAPLCCRVFFFLDLTADPA